MKAVLIFDNSISLIYWKWDDTFLEQMKRFSDNDNEECKTDYTDKYCVAQILAPVITSQQVMAAQFGNTYSSMQCENGTNIVFDELIDYVLMIVSEDSVENMHRELLDYKTFLQHICGSNITLLQIPSYRDWLSVLIDSRTKGDSIPGATGVITKTAATEAGLNYLKMAAKDIKFPYNHYHLLLYVGDKMLALYSSRGSDDLSPADIILLSVQCVAAQEYWTEEGNDDSRANKANLSSHHVPWLASDNSGIVNLCGYNLESPCTPHAMYLAEIAPRVILVILVDMGLRDISISTYHSSQYICNLKKLLYQRSSESLTVTLDALDSAVKKTIEALRKQKLAPNTCTRLASRMLEFKKCCSSTTPLAGETALNAVQTALAVVKEELQPAVPKLSFHNALRELKKKLSPFMDFLMVKANRHFGQESVRDRTSVEDLRMIASVSRQTYVDDFPGLVHFIYVDRTTGRFLAPDLVDCIELLTPDMLRAMFTRSLQVIREGYTAATWRAGALHACAVLWWEKAGVTVKPRNLHPAAVRALPPPGDILGTFYRQLTDLAFPNETNIVTKELLCIYLGLLPAATAIQQARRLAHTVYDLAGHVHHSAIDLL